MSQPWVFMGVDRSHFSAKLRPVLRFKKVHHVEYPPDMGLIQARTGVAFIPILISPNDETLQDTTDIIDVLETQIPDPAIIPNGPDRVVARLFELYGDEFFPLVSMRTRWVYPENNQELRRAFAAFSGSAERGEKTADLMSSFLPALGITDETIPAIDAHTEELLSLLSSHFEQHNFLLGDRLSLADCALMGPLYAHLYLDRVTRAQLYDTALPVCMWIERCNRPVPEQMGAWFNGDYPVTLQAIFDLLSRDVVPMLSASHAAFSAWVTQEGQSGMELPRGVGPYQWLLRGTTVNAMVRSYVSWKLQRLAEAQQSLDSNAQAQTRELFQQMEALPLLDVPAHRAHKDNFKLVLD